MALLRITVTMLPCIFMVKSYNIFPRYEEQKRIEQEFNARSIM